MSSCCNPSLRKIFVAAYSLDRMVLISVRIAFFRSVRSSVMKALVHLCVLHAWSRIMVALKQLNRAPAYRRVCELSSNIRCASVTCSPLVVSLGTLPSSSSESTISAMSGCGSGSTVSAVGAAWPSAIRDSSPYWLNAFCTRPVKSMFASVLAAASLRRRALPNLPYSSWMWLSHSSSEESGGIP